LQNKYELDLGSLLKETFARNACQKVGKIKNVLVKSKQSVKSLKVSCQRQKLQLTKQKIEQFAFYFIIYCLVSFSPVVTNCFSHFSLEFRQTNRRRCKIPPPAVHSSIFIRLGPNFPFHLGGGLLIVFLHPLCSFCV